MIYCTYIRMRESVQCAAARCYGILLFTAFAALFGKEVTSLRLRQCYAVFVIQKSRVFSLRGILTARFPTPPPLPQQIRHDVDAISLNKIFGIYFSTCKL